MKKYIIVLAAVVSLILAQQAAKAAGANTKKKEKKEMVYNVTTIEVAPSTIHHYVQSTATLRPDKQVDIFSKVPGLIRELRVEEGQSIEKGEVLAVLDGDDVRLELEQAQVNLKKAKLEHERMTKTYRVDLVSAEDFDQKKFELEKAQADYNLAAYKSSLVEVIAPFSGTVVARLVEEGQTIQPSDKLFALASLSLLEADVFLPEPKSEGLQEGQKALLSKDEYFRDVFEARVERISPIVDRETGTVKVTLAVDSAPQGVRSGTYVHLQIVTGKTQAPTTVPRKALVFDSRENAAVFVVVEKEDGVKSVEKIDITLGPGERDRVSVEGLEPGTIVILTGKESLKTGSLIKES